MRRIAATLIVTGLVLAGASPALASCAELPDIEQAFADAELVFVGIVTEVTNLGRTATMDVEQVWKGSELSGVVTVNGGPDDAELITSVDRTFEFGAVYLVFPVNTSAPFEDNACTATQRFNAGLDVINPFAEEPEEDPGVIVPTTTPGQGASAATTVASATTGDESTGAGWLILGAGLGGALAAALAAVLWRRTRT